MHAFLIFRMVFWIAIVTYVAMIIRSIVRQRYRTALLLLLIGMCVVGVVMYKLHTITDPYIIEPLSALPVPDNTAVGHSINGKMLSVVSTDNVVCVVDPGVSFAYRVVWLVPKPRTDTEHKLVEYKYVLQFHTNANDAHVNGLNSEVPNEIAVMADGNRWY